MPSRAHGLGGHPRDHELLRRHLAEEGFVVVAPAFPLTNHDVPDGFANAGDTAGQVADISFLIDAVLADPVLSGAVDASSIGVAGHSLGGSPLPAPRWPPTATTESERRW